MGIIKVDLFSEDVDSLDHPELLKFRRLMEEVADECQGNIVSFDIDHGTVSFSFDNDEFTKEVSKTLQNHSK